MADAKIITAGVFLTLILGGVVTYQFLPEDLSRAYICNLNNVTGLFDKLSSSNITAYYNLNGVNKQMTCKTRWIKLTDWCETNKVDCNNFVKEGFPSDDKLIPADVYDESGALLVKDSKVTVDKDIMLNVNGSVINITYKPVIACVYGNKSGTIEECLKQYEKQR